MPIPVVEFIIDEMLREHITAVQADPDLLDDFFEGLPLTRTKEVKRWIENKNIQVSIGFPQTGAIVPSISIVLADLRLTNEGLGEIIQPNVEVPEDFAELGDIEGGYYRGSYMIWVMTDNADSTALLGNMVVEWLEADFPPLDAGIYEHELSASDLTAEMQFLPEHLYVRVITISVGFFVHTLRRYRKIREAEVTVKEPDNTLSDLVNPEVATLE